MDRAFGVLLMAGALLALWLYDTGRLSGVLTAIQQPGGGQLKPAAVVVQSTGSNLPPYIPQATK